jgi:small subunit ribosomal protein S20
LASKKNKSARKRERQNLKRRLRNKSTISALRTQMKKVRTAIQAKDAEKARAELVKTASMLDKAASKGIIHKNKASRHVSRLSKQVFKAFEVK